MTALLLLWIGRRAGEAWESLAAEYRSRIARYAELKEVRLRPEAGRDLDPGRALAREAAQLRRHLKPGDAVAALDERGRERTTEQLAAWLAARPPAGRTVLVIGSDLGLDAEFKASAAELLALSRLTLGHQLARVVLLEQLYRALDFNAGGPYHRGSRQQV